VSHDDLPESNVVSKGACPACPSSDACALYDDGHSHCFSCNTHFPADGEAAPSEPRKPSNPDLVQGVRYVDLDKRGLRSDTCKRYGYGVAEASGRPTQVAPYHNAAGEVVAQKLRFADKTFSVRGDLKQGGLFGQHLFRTGSKMVVVTEGEIDALSVAQAMGNKWPAVSIPNGAAGAVKAIKANLEWLSSHDSVILWFDSDEPGRDALNAVLPLLPIGKVKIVTGPADCKDANDVLLKHGASEVVKLVWDAPSWRPDGVIGGKELTVERLKAKAAPGWQTPYPEVNAMTRGIRPRQLWLLTAGTGVGKSTDAREWMYAALCQGKKVGAVFLEESVEDTAKYLVALDNNVLAEDLEDNPDILTQAQWERSTQKLFGSDAYQAYDHFGATDSDGLLAKLEFMAANGAELLFLDHLTIAATGLDLEGVDKLMVSLRAMIERTGCSVVAIAHIRKTASGAKAAEEGAQISLDDIKGSGSLKQVPDVILAKERNQQAETAVEKNRSRIRVLKVRRGGKTGPADWLLYDEKTGRLTPIPDPGESDAFKDETNGDDDIPF
jgi:twinkle protein